MDFSPNFPFGDAPSYRDGHGAALFFSKVTSNRVLERVWAVEFLGAMVNPAVILGGQLSRRVVLWDIPSKLPKL